MFWAIYAVVHSMLRAGFVEASRVYASDGWCMGFWQSFFGMLVMMLFMPFMVWPQSVIFYITAIDVAIIFSVGTLIQIKLAVEKKGRVAAVYMPLEALTAMAVWVWIDSRYNIHQINYDPLALVSIAFAFVLSSFALFKIRANDIGFLTFVIAAPVGLIYAFAGVTTKVVLGSGNSDVSSILPIALAYTLFCFMIMTAIMGIALLVKRKVGAELVNKRAIQGGLLAGAFSALSYLTFILSVSLAPNPGFTSMIAMLLPVWLLVWHGLKKLQDKASSLAALFIVISVILLIVASLHL